MNTTSQSLTGHRETRRQAAKAAGVFCVALLAGCGREEIKVYRVAKEAPEPAARPADHQHEPADGSSEAQLSWTLPEGWSVQPSRGSMRLATFAVSGQGGEQANAAVIALPSGRDFDVINILRQNVGLVPATEAELAQLTQPVTIGPGQGRLIDMATDSATNSSLGRILVGIMEHDGKSWFFSMSGSDAFVRLKQPSFLQFLKSVTFNEAGPSPALASAPRPVSTNVKETPRDAETSKPTWIVPPGWKEQPPSAMRIGSYLVTGNDGRKVDISITMLAGDAGGPLANVNRWRGQIKLPDITHAELKGLVATLEGQGGVATMVDMSGVDAKSGQKARLLAAFQMRGGQTWFFKMIGDEQLVGSEREAFIAFVKSVKYADAL